MRDANLFDVRLETLYRWELRVLRSVWQTYWLHQNWDGNADFCDQLEQSLRELEGRFQNFMEQLEEAGWNTHQLSLKVPKEQSFEEIGVV